MPKYKVEAEGKKYTITAPSKEAALQALSQKLQREVDITTPSEDIQGAGTKILDGLLLGFGDEAAAAMRAGLDVGVAGLFGEEASLYGGEFGKAYNAIVQQQRDVEQRFAQQNPNVALASEVAGGVLSGGLTGAGALRGAAKIAAERGTTRGLNAAVAGAVGLGEGATYALGEKEGDFIERVEDFDGQDAIISGMGLAAGALGGSLVRGTSASSKSLKEIGGDVLMRLKTAREMPDAVPVKSVAEDIGEATYKAMAEFSPTLAKGAGKTLDVLTDAVSDATSSIRPALSEIKRGFDKTFQPVKDFARDRVDEVYGLQLNRGAINGQVKTNQLDSLLEQDKMFEVRNAMEGSERTPIMRAAMADYANPELPMEKRMVGLQTLKRELNNDELFAAFEKYIDDQEALLDDIAKGTQSFKRTRGYMSVARESKSKDDLATRSLEAERIAAEKEGRLSTADASAKEKKKLSRLNADGTGLSKYGENNPIMNPVDSHHYWMRSHTQLNEMNKALGLRGATTKEEVDEIAKGGFFGRQLKEKMEAKGLTKRQVEDAVEIYNQVVWGSQRSMSKEFQAVRNLGYASAIGNPYGAALQVHDLLNAAWANGSENVLMSFGKRNGFDLTVEDVGIAQQFHSEIVNPAKKVGKLGDAAVAEWAADRSQRLLDWSLGVTGYKKLDSWTKGKIMSSALGREFSDLAKDAAAWRSKWGKTFNDAEMLELEDALKKQDMTNPLVHQLALINLSDLQPISAASSSLRQLSTPNARVLYMLKGFAMTQLQLVRRRIAGQLKSGNRKEALKDAMAYMLISGGGYGVVNETRQLIKLEAPDYGNVPALAFYQMMSIPTMGAFGGNQYAAHLFAANPVEQTMMNFVPVIPVAEGIGKDLMNLVTDGQIVPNKTLSTMPVIGPVYKGISDKLDSE